MKKYFKELFGILKGEIVDRSNIPFDRKNWKPCAENTEKLALFYFSKDLAERKQLEYILKDKINSIKGFSLFPIPLSIAVVLFGIIMDKNDSVAIGALLALYLFIGILVIRATEAERYLYYYLNIIDDIKIGKIEEVEIEVKKKTIKYNK